MKRRLLLPAGLSIILALVIVGCGGGEAPTPTPVPPTATPVPAPTVAPASSGETAASGSGEVVKINLTENPYSYVPDGFNFTVGTTYTLDFAPPGEFHTFTVTDLGIDIFINANEAVTSDITPNTAGTFDLTCVPHEALGMVGSVTVA